MPNCSIVSCGIKKSAKRPNISLHRLPTNYERRKKWLDAIGEENLKTCTKSIFVCSLHFEELSFNRTLSKPILRDDAVPSKTCLLTLPEQQSSPLQDRLVDEGSASEHGYSSDEPSTSRQSIEATQKKSCLYTCHECKQNIVNARFACLQCESYDVCVRCAASDVHEDHYLLRVPKYSTQGETQVVLQAVRAQLKSLLPEKTKQENISKGEDTIREGEEVVQLRGTVQNEPIEKDPLALDVQVKYSSMVEAECPAEDNSGHPKSKKERLSKDKCELPSTTNKLQIEGREQFTRRTLGTPSRPRFAKRNSYILKFKRRTVFTQWCKESGPTKLRRIKMLRTLYNWLPKSTQVDITKLVICVNKLCEQFETYEKQSHGDYSSIVNKYSEWFDVQEVINW